MTDFGRRRILIIEARFYDKIADQLLEGAKAELDAAGADYEVISLPGALEIPTIAAKIADSGDYDALVCLGCVIQGGTAHFDHVCRVAMDSIGAIAERGTIAIANGVLTVDSMEQALDRVGGAYGHKGAEAALTAVEIATLLKELRS